MIIKKFLTFYRLAVLFVSLIIVILAILLGPYRAWDGFIIFFYSLLFFCFILPRYFMIVSKYLMAIIEKNNNEDYKTSMFDPKKIYMGDRVCQRTDGLLKINKFGILNPYHQGIMSSDKLICVQVQLSILKDKPPSFCPFLFFSMN